MSWGELPWFTKADVISFYIGITGIGIVALYYLIRFLRKRWGSIKYGRV